VEDQGLPVLDEKTYVKLTALALWESLPWVLLAGALFTLVCLPAALLALLGFLVPGLLLGALTAGPGWAALNALVALALLRAPGKSALDFFRAFGRFYTRGAVLGGGMAVPLVTAAISLPLLREEPVPPVVWAGLGADLAGLFLLTALYLYAFPQIVLYDAGLRVALRNSFVLAVRYLANTLGLIGMAALLALLAARVSGLLLVILPAAWSVFVINNCRMVLRRELGEG
jgi:uncharacterized membrane protein YesL